MFVSVPAVQRESTHIYIIYIYCSFFFVRWGGWVVSSSFGGCPRQASRHRPQRSKGRTILDVMTPLHQAGGAGPPPGAGAKSHATSWAGMPISQEMGLPGPVQVACAAPCHPGAPAIREGLHPPVPQGAGGADPTPHPLTYSRVKGLGGDWLSSDGWSAPGPAQVPCM